MPFQHQFAPAPDDVESLFAKKKFSRHFGIVEGWSEEPGWQQRKASFNGVVCAEHDDATGMTVHLCPKNFLRLAMTAQDQYKVIVFPNPDKGPLTEDR